MKRLRFVLSLITGDNDYQRRQASAAQEAAIRLGVDVRTIFANNNVIDQSQQLIDAIHAVDRVDGILVEPAGQTGFPQVAQAAVSAGTAWVILNCEPNYLSKLRSGSAVPVFAVSADNREVGRIQGRQLEALLPEGGTVLYLRGPSQSLVTEQRSVGMMETKPAHINVRVLKSTQWTEDAGFHAVGSWLRLSTAHQDEIDVVQAQNDFLAVGARRALEQPMTRPHRPRLLFLGVDGLPKTGQAWVRQDILAATIVVPAIAAHALEALAAAVTGRVRPPERTLIAPESFPALGELLAKSATRRLARGDRESS
jgi:ABC-type sugar transport system substrate-binding protein